ncbi:MAG: 30S ribosomal protein S3 [Candidatus Aenigmarchaeota archaeon]|nr:30S ribosomal protein S3 [Candidatus Aenigmarchaeota archaeon]
MAVERLFVKGGIKNIQVEEFLRKKFERADYSHAEIQRTTLGTRIIIWVFKPGLVVGKSGKRVEEIAKEIEERFGLENPMIDVREVENPFLDANVVARRVARAIEKGVNFKRVANYYLTRVMETGAIGIQIKIGGKLAGSERSRFQKFKAGYIRHAGEYAEKVVECAEAQASIKPGIVGIQVKIMKEMPKEVKIEKEFKLEKQ